VRAGRPGAPPAGELPAATRDRAPVALNCRVNCRAWVQENNVLRRALERHLVAQALLNRMLAEQRAQFDREVYSLEKALERERDNPVDIVSCCTGWVERAGVRAGPG